MDASGCLYVTLPRTSFLLYFIITFLLSIQPFLCAADTICNSPWWCSPSGPLIQYPFWLKGQESDLCGFPAGIELSCNNKNQTILSLPFSGEFVVKLINYVRQVIIINDPDSCLPNRMRNFSLTDSPFTGLNFRRYKFVNCSSNWTESTSNTLYRPVPMFCLSGGNYTVYAVNSLMFNQEMPSSCADINLNDSVSSLWSVSEYWSSMNRRGDLLLQWSDPRCFPCEAQGLACGVTDDNEIDCVATPKRGSSFIGLPRGAKYGIIVGAGIPALLFIIGLAGYTCGRIRANGLRRRIDTELSATITPQPVVTVAGLDGRIIESLPKTVLGESGRLPKPNDSTCPICLCEYQPKETLRTIPECNHYFHANCIDEWLKLNGTCPLCRNSPESLSVTPCSSMSSSTSSTSS